ncbi:MAG: multiheme c-type cytochrome [Fuerstiella sp.]
MLRAVHARCLILVLTFGGALAVWASQFHVNADDSIPQAAAQVESTDPSISKAKQALLRLSSANSGQLQNAAAAVDRSHFMGSRACLDCHRSEYVSWLSSQHFSNSKKDRFEASESSIDTKYLSKVGNLDLCYTCHMPPAEKRFGRQLVEAGVSCESCHGAAGGEQGWLNRHAVYGPNVTKLEHETPQHLADRHAACDAAGMIRAGQPYAIAKNCFGCHIIAEPTLVGEDVKHPVSFDKYSLIPYMQGEVRHNFHRNQRVNAETPTLDHLRRGMSLTDRTRIYFIMEQFAKSEVVLNHLAALPNEEALEDDLAGDLIDIFDDAAGELEDFFDELEEPEDEDIAGLSDEELAPLLTVVETFEDFDDIDNLTRADAAAAAAKVAAAAASFLNLHDGSRLKALDEAFLEDLDDPVGAALEP